MASTGEVGCIGTDFDDALLKAMLSVGYRIPQKRILVSSGPIRSKLALIGPLSLLVEKGYSIAATKGTAKFLNDNGVKAEATAWPDENEHPNCLDLIKSKEVELVINIPKNLSTQELDNDYTIRRAAIDYNVPLITNARLGAAFLYSIHRKDIDDLGINRWSEFV